MICESSSDRNRKFDRSFLAIRAFISLSLDEFMVSLRRAANLLPLMICMPANLLSALTSSSSSKNSEESLNDLLKRVTLFSNDLRLH